MIRIPHLETDITTVCQLSCVGCNHSVPLYRTTGAHLTATPQSVEKDLSHLTTFLHADKWGALGGEPTLSRHLVDILHVVRDSRIADEIEIWTNGLTLVTPRRLDWATRFWTAPFDTLVVSAYPGKLTDFDVDTLKYTCENYGKRFVLKDERNKPNFQNMLDPLPSDAARTQAKFDRCFFRKFSRVVNNGYFWTCCCGPHIPVLLQDQPFGTDGIAVEGLTEAALQAYLDRTTPLGACTACAGRDGVAAKPIPWSEERHPFEWLRKSQGL